MDIRFYANLGDDNADQLGLDIGSREGILLSAPGVSPKTAEVARGLSVRSIPLAADNGNTAVIHFAAGEFLNRARELEGEAAKESAAGAGLMSAPLRAKYRTLTADIARRCAEFAAPERQRGALASQAAVAPEFFMCLEDLTIPVLISLDVDPAATGRRRSGFVALQRRGLAAVDDVLRGQAGPAVGIPYATLHAYDYDGACQVGAQAAPIEGLQGLAVGLASFLNDRGYTSDYTLKGRRVWVDGRRHVPRRYLRLLLVTLGLLDGFRGQGRPIPRLHGLGGGAPMVLPFLALCAYGSPMLSTDSTSPEKNASMGKLFVSTPAPMTVGIAAVAQALIEERRTWDCPCPGCSALEKLLPKDLPSARGFYRKNIAPKKIENRDLEDAGGIGRFIPLCWEAAAKETRALVKRARSEHNQWAIAEIARGLREHSSTYAQLREWVGSLCRDYSASAQPTYALQFDECLRLVDRLRPGS